MRLARLALAALALALSAAGAGVGGAGAARAGGPPQPVVVELFTSEGCSACPPADALLDRLAREQPVAGAEVVALELHVDYFDRAGSVDPFSQASFSARQAEYIRAFGKRGAYTPQLVIDGQREVVGTRERETLAAIADAARAPKAKVQISRSGDRLAIAIDGLAEGGNDTVDVMLALTEERLSAHGLSGGGAHGPVVRELRRVTTVNGAQGLVHVKDVEVRLDPSWRRENVRAVAFAQRPKTLEILGAGALSLQ